MSDLPAPTPRTVRSFVKRGGRTTLAQSRALTQLWPSYGVDPGVGEIDLDALYGRRAPRVLEIGFGDGESLVSRAAATPEADFLGVEVHPPGVGHCLLLAADAALCNMRVVRQDAIEVLTLRVAPACLSEVLIWFPDPWPKKRHHKRRIIQPEFATLVASRLAPGGRLRFATDWQPYAEHALDVLNAHSAFRNRAPDSRFVARPTERPLTKFERRGLRLGHAVYDLDYSRL